MGGERTEPATQKKLTDARKEGQVAKSREIANCMGLLSLFLVLKIWVGRMGFSRNLQSDSRYHYLLAGLYAREGY